MLTSDQTFPCIENFTRSDDIEVWASLDLSTQSWPVHYVYATHDFLCVMISWIALYMYLDLCV